ncbi:MAG TPA: dicarboxylate transporter/tellurite-resistance protein TehA [Rhodanobacter sp.]
MNIHFHRAVPASYFGMVLGLVGLGSAWRAATALWGFPAAIGESVMAIGVLVWATVTIAYLGKWLFAREDALDEAQHAIQCCFIGLFPASTSLMGLVLAPYAHQVAVTVWVVGAGGQMAFGVFRSGGMWRGGRDINATTPVLFLPTVAGNLISAIVAGVLGFPSWGMLFFGIGFFNWIVMESVILMRLWMGPPLPVPLRPTLGIQLAPPVVATVAWLANTHGLPDLFVQAMWGYGLFQLLMLARLLPWVAKQPFAPSYWAFSFGVTAIATGALQMTLRGSQGAIPQLAPAIFILANGTIAVLVIGTVIRLLQGRLLPPPAATTPLAGTATSH